MGDDLVERTHGEGAGARTDAFRQLIDLEPAPPGKLPFRTSGMGVESAGRPMTLSYQETAAFRSFTARLAIALSIAMVRTFFPEERASKLAISEVNHSAKARMESADSRVADTIDTDPGTVGA